MNKVLDWLADWLEETFKTRRARIILAIALVLYITMLAVFGGPIAVVLGLASLWVLFLIVVFVGGFIVWVLDGDD